MPDLLSQAADLPSFRVVPPRRDVRLDDLKLPDGTPMVGGDGMLIPPARNFSMVVNAATRVYSYRFDEAMRDNTVSARAMRRDGFLRGLIEERILPTINRQWHLEVDDDGDPDQVQVREGLTRLISHIRDFDAFKRAQLDAVWFGRAGCQWGFKRIAEVDNLWGLTKWDPLHGDSIQFTFDGIPAVLLDGMTTGWYAQHGATQGPGGDLRPTDRGGTALVLQRPYWRDRFAIHRHMMEKADFFEGELAGSVQGLGLRGLVYWHYVIRTDALSWMLAYMQAVGQMDLMVFNYPAGNAAAEAQQKVNAQQVIGKAAIACPRNPTGNWPAVEQISMNSNGLKALHDLISDYFDRHIERLIVGQSMSSGADNSSGLGGTGRAEFAKATKDEILVYDTGRLDNTLTYDLVGPLKRYNFPWATFPVRFRSIMPDLDATDKVRNGEVMIRNGVSIRVDEWREAAGFTRPEEGDEIIGGAPPQMDPSGGGMPGMPPGGDPNAPPGAPPGVPPGGTAVDNGAPPGPAPGVPGLPPAPFATPRHPAAYNPGPMASPGTSPAMGFPGGGNTYIPKREPEQQIGFTRYVDSAPTPYAGTGPKKYACVMADLTGEAAVKILQMAADIPDEDLADDGREDTPHVTVLYGLHDGTLDAARRVLAGSGAVKIKLGDVSIFSGEESGKDYDVVKVDVESDDLRLLNHRLRALPHTSNFPDYKPHATIAYVKKGKGAEWAAKLADPGCELSITEVVYSSPDKKRAVIPLAGKVDYARHSHRAPAGGIAHKNKLYRGGRFAPAPPPEPSAYADDDTPPPNDTETDSRDGDVPVPGPKPKPHPDDAPRAKPEPPKPAKSKLTTRTLRHDDPELVALRTEASSIPDSHRRDAATRALSPSRHDEAIVAHDPAGKLHGAGSLWHTPDLAKAEGVPESHGGYVRIRDVGSAGGGAGTAIFNAAVQAAAAKGAGVYLNSMESSRGFWEKMGMHPATGGMYYLTPNEVIALVRGKTPESPESEPTPPLPAVPTSPVPDPPGMVVPVSYESPEAFAKSLAAAAALSADDSPEDREAREQALIAVAKAVPPTALKRLSENRLVGAVNHATVESVMAAWYEANSPETPPEQRRRVAGFYSVADGVIHGNGHDPSGVYAHEIGHAIDASAGRDWFELSESDWFRYAWSQELKSRKLSNFAATDPTEGFAEFCRLVYAVPGGARRAQTEFPLCYQFFAHHGLVTPPGTQYRRTPYDDTLPEPPEPPPDDKRVGSDPEPTPPPDRSAGGMFPPGGGKPPPSGMFPSAGGKPPPQVTVAGPGGRAQFSPPTAPPPTMPTRAAVETDEQRRQREMDEAWAEYETLNAAPAHASEPDVGVQWGGALRHVDADAADIAKANYAELLGDNAPPPDVLVGAPPEAKVAVVGFGTNTVHIGVSDPRFKYCERLLTRDYDGTLFIKNLSFVIKDEYQNGGIGADVFSAQVAACSAAGVSYIECMAAKGPKYNGYYTWPRMGYDALLADVDLTPEKRQYIAAAFPGAKSVLDLFATRAGREWWGGKKLPDGTRTEGNGVGINNARFDLDPKSRSMQVLRAYVEELKAKKQGVNMPEQQNNPVTPEQYANHGYPSHPQPGTPNLTPTPDESGGGFEDIQLTPEQEAALDAAWAKLTGNK